MAKSSTKKPGGRKSQPKAATAAAPAPKDHNGLDDNALKELFLQHIDEYEDALAVKKKGDADFKNACKRIKAEGGKNQIADIKTAIRLNTDEGEAEVKSEIASTIRVGRWMGTSIGTQFEMFEGEDRTPAVDRARQEGKRACFNNQPRKPPYAPSVPQYQAWCDGYDEGQAELAKGIKPLAGDPPTGSVSREEFKRTLSENTQDFGKGPPIGDAPATHAVTE